MTTKIEVLKTARMSTKTMIKKYEAKGYTMRDLQEHYQIHKATMSYKDWLQMMKDVVEVIQVKTW